MFCAQSPSAHFQDTIPHRVCALESGGGEEGLLARFQHTGLTPQADSSSTPPLPGPLGVPASGGPVNSKVYGAS